MKISKLIGIATLILASNSYGFCVYNQTLGNDTFNKKSRLEGEKVPTLIRFNEETRLVPEKVKQGDYKCDSTNHHQNTDTSKVQIEWLTETSYLFNTSKVICNSTVYNKDGYIIVKGDAKNGFSCAAYRNPI